MKKDKDRLPSPTVALRLEAARRLGYESEILDLETSYLFELRRGAQRRILLGAYAPINDASAARIATDKFHAGLVLARAGIPVPDTARCLVPGRYEDDAFLDHTGTAPGSAFAAASGFPVIVKPNRGARGRDVLLTEDDGALVEAIERVWRFDYLALVQRPAPGIDVRLDFLDDDFLFGYQRAPVQIVGDGDTTAGDLLGARDPRFATPAFQRQLGNDPIVDAALGGRDLGSVLARGETITFATPIMNLNRLCVAERLVDPPAAWVEQGLRVGRAIGLRHFGVDFKTPGLDHDPTSAVVVDVNAFPSLVHMSRMGHYEAVIAAEMKVLAAALASGSGR